MEPHRGRARASFKAESKRSLACLADVILGVSDVEDAGLGRAGLELQKNSAGRRGVLNFLRAELQRMLGLNDFFFRGWRLLFFLRLFSGFVLRRRLRLRPARIHSSEHQSGGPTITN